MQEASPTQVPTIRTLKFVEVAEHLGDIHLEWIVFQILLM